MNMTSRGKILLQMALQDDPLQNLSLQPCSLNKKSDIYNFTDNEESNDFEQKKAIDCEKTQLRTRKIRSKNDMSANISSAEFQCCKSFDKQISKSSLAEDDDDSVRDRSFDINDYDCDTQSSAASSVTLSEIITRNQSKYLFKENTQTVYNNIIENGGTTHPNNVLLEKENRISKETVNHARKDASLSETIKQKRKTRIITCKLCTADIATKNFMRHIERHHKNEKEILTLDQYPKGSKERRRAFALLRNSINFDLYIKGIVRPNRTVDCTDPTTYYPCAYCRGLFSKQYLRRHSKRCYVQKEQGNRLKGNHVGVSQSLVACAMDTTDTIAKLNVKENVYDIMKGDDIAFVAKKDLLIAHFGESYLKKHRRERMHYACSNRMRELARLLIHYRKIINNEDVTLKNVVHPRNFEIVLQASREISGYDHEKKTFKAPSLAMHIGTSLRLICEELIRLILQESDGFKCALESDKQIWIYDVKNFKKLVETRWNTELSSLANKDLLEKRWNKPLLLPLVSDIRKFREEVSLIAENCVEELCKNNENEKSYKLLVQCTLALLIVFNRRRIGDVQFLKIDEYKNDKKSNYKDFEQVLTDTEKALTQKYKRILTAGKGSRAVVILLPEILEKYINILLEKRKQFISDCTNEYVFAMPDSKIKWGKGDVAIRNLCKLIKLENASAITSNKMRKQIATVMQILSLSHEEAKQFANFMGHTQKTHEEFYKLPVDLYQTAKVSKILLMMEKGTMPLEFKGKSLQEINIDVDYPEMDQNNDEGREIDIANQQSKTDKKDVFGDSNAVLLNAQTIIMAETSSNKSKIRQTWTDSDIEDLKKNFQHCLRTKTYPSSKEVKKFISQYQLKRNVVAVKSKLQHLIKFVD